MRRHNRHILFFTLFLDDIICIHLARNLIAQVSRDRARNRTTRATCRSSMASNHRTRIIEIKLESVDSLLQFEILLLLRFES